LAQAGISVKTFLGVASLNGFFWEIIR